MSVLESVLVNASLTKSVERAALYVDAESRRTAVLVDRLERGNVSLAEHFREAVES